MGFCMEEISDCRICKHELIPVWPLLDAPYGDLFKTRKEQAVSLQKHSITLARCTNCKLLQLLNTTNVSDLYDEYLYFTKNTNQLGKFYSEIAQQLIQEFNRNYDGKILDIGSNDGTFLDFFSKKGFQVLGIDPSKPACDYSNQLNIYTINDYFNKKSIVENALQKFSYSLIAINYTLANVPSVSDFLVDVASIMSDETLLSVVTGYHLDQFTHSMFDYIGHDHLTYLTITDFDALCKKIGLKIIDVNRYEHKGGSIHVILSKASSSHMAKSSVKQNLQREMWLRSTSDENIHVMASNVARSKETLQNLISSDNSRLVGGVGASISTSHLINEFEIADKIKILFDDDANKIGKYSPFYGIPVHDLERLDEKNPEILVVLAWQHSNKLLERLKTLKYKGLVVIPLPYFKVLHLEG